MCLLLRIVHSDGIRQVAGVLVYVRYKVILDHLLCILGVEICTSRCDGTPLSLYI
jgi:hypothetical protein